MEPRDLAVALARGRVAIGLTALAFPAVAGRVMTGSDGSRGATKLFVRLVGVRDAALGLGTIIALDRGMPVRGWLEASALVDATDLAACLAAREDIPRPSLAGAAGLATTGALLSAWLARWLDPPPDAAPGHPEAVATGHPPDRVWRDRCG